MNELYDVIDSRWPSLIVSTPHETESHLSLPNPFIAPSVEPNNNFVFKEQFYWDSYFTILPHIGSAMHETAKGMTDNLLFMLRNLGYVPNSSNKFHLGRSQPPLLSSMVRLIYEVDIDKSWLADAYGLLVEEYYTVWLSNTHPHNRKVDSVLSRYYHENQEHSGAEDESGWDKTTRFEDRALDILPVDLNALLYKFETDLAYFSDQLNNNETETWLAKSEARKQRINELMWNDELGLYVDYDFVNNKQMSCKSLACYVPLFVGLAEQAQAEQLRDNLQLFETEFGLTTTAKEYDIAPYKQWSSPNGWAPLHFFVVEGLSRYGYEEEATRVAQKWVKSVDYIYKETGELYEKYNVVDPSQPPTSAIYPDQKGFAWTNAVTQVFIAKYTK